MLYRLQDTDLFGRSRNNTVARDAATHALYQYEYCLFIAQNMYWPDMTPAARWYGGSVDELWDMMYEHPPSNGIAQANDTAVLHGIEIGALQPGLGTFVDGQSGAVYPHVRLYFDAPGQSGIGTAFVPYKAKPGKGFAGKQWK